MMLPLTPKPMSSRHYSWPRSSSALLVTLAIVMMTITIITYHRRSADSTIPNEVDRSAADYSGQHLQTIEAAKRCFRLKDHISNIDFLEDILKSKIRPEPNKCIFFVVTSCLTNGRVSLNPRQACTIESAAQWNPHRNIFVLFASPVGYVQNETISPVVRVLQTYSNVHFRHINLYTYSIDTPAEDWIKTDKIFLSQYLIAHMADYLRFLTLYKFGGIYLDLDVVVRQSFDEMPINFAGAESDNLTSTSVLGFDSDDIGHKIIEMIIKENTENYLPQDWAYSGPGAVTRVLQKICRKNYVADLRPEFCWGLTVFPSNAFYPVHWTQWSKYFDASRDNLNETLNAIQDSIAVHMWNRMSAQKILSKSEPKTVYGILAEKNCPNVFEASGFYF